MLRRIILAGLLITVAGLGAGARAQDGAGGEKRRDIKRLLALTRAGETGLQVMEQLLPNMREIYGAVLGSLAPAKRERAVAIMEEELRRQFTPEHVVEQIVPIYDRLFTAEEVKSLIAFYESPAGGKFISVMPQIIRESGAVAETLAAEAVGRVVRRFQQEGIEPPPAGGARRPAPRPRRRP